jgi:hypothetical protein
MRNVRRERGKLRANEKRCENSERRRSEVTVVINAVASQNNLKPIPVKEC